MNGSFTMVTPVYEVTADGMKPSGWLRGMTFWMADATPDGLAEPFMYPSDEEEEPWCEQDIDEFDDDDN